MGLLDKVKGNKKLKDMIFSYDKSDKNHTEFISTGCLSLNVLFSGKLDGGIPKGKISTIAAPSASGKSFVGMKVVKNAQKAGMDVIYLDTEFAFSYSMANNLGIDESKLLVIQDNQIEDVQKNIMTIFDDIEIEERKNVILVIDSWGGFVTSKTITDATSGKDVTDMTISKKKNSLARILTGLRTTVFIVAQTYECQKGETLIKTPSGDRMLKDLSKGDIVETTEGYQEIKYTTKHDNATVLEIELEDGTILETTENHKFVIQEEVDGILETRWVTSGELTTDMDIKII